MPTTERSRAAAEGDGDPRKSRLAYHLRCRREDATDPELSSVDRLALVRDRVARIREIQAKLRANHVRPL